MIEMPKNEWVDLIVRNLYDNGVYQPTFPGGQNLALAWKELYQKGMIDDAYIFSSKTKLTDKGKDFAESGLLYYDWLMSSRSNSNVHIGHNINAPVNNTDLSNRNNTSDKADFSIRRELTAKMGVREMIAWIVTLIVGLIQLYEYAVKYHWLGLK